MGTIAALEACDFRRGAVLAASATSLLYQSGFRFARRLSTRPPARRQSGCALLLAGAGHLKTGHRLAVFAVFAPSEERRAATKARRGRVASQRGGLTRTKTKIAAQL